MILEFFCLFKTLHQILIVFLQVTFFVITAKSCISQDSFKIRDKYMQILTLNFGDSFVDFKNPHYQIERTVKSQSEVYFCITGIIHVIALN